MVFKTTLTDEGGVLVLSGELTIERAYELRSALINSLEEVDFLILKPEGVSCVDLSCLQILCSANRTFQDLDKHLAIDKNNESEVFQDALIDAGFANSNYVSNNHCKRCLWKEVKR